MTMLGASFPQTEIGTDPAAVRDWAVAVEAMGLGYVLAFDHVLGARPGHPALAGMRFGFTSESLVHEPFVLFGYLAALTRRVELVSGIVILPQRQTALVAKQAAEVDVLSGGRLRLGVGLGWNCVEFEALGEEFHNRGRRVEEQVEVLRLLWTEELVSYRGRWHTIDDAGLHPRPVQRPIPIWFGVEDDRAVERAGRIGDGWIALGRPDAENARRAALLREAAARAGRDPAALRIVGPIGLRGDTTPDDWRRACEGWQRLGATHVTVNTLNAGCPSVAAHLEALDRVRQVLARLLD
ncbi:MAG TPA: LLM class F420-dependent oxidoreductase [Chloroflexota bacterium]|jgi:probable F420-dependent oxidoreductase